MPSCARSKCRPFGVIVPSSACSGVRADPVPVVPGTVGDTFARPCFRSGWLPIGQEWRARLAHPCLDLERRRPRRGGKLRPPLPRRPLPETARAGQQALAGGRSGAVETGRLVSPGHCFPLRVASCQAWSPCRGNVRLADLEGNSVRSSRRSDRARLTQSPERSPTRRHVRAIAIQCREQAGPVRYPGKHPPPERLNGRDRRGRGRRGA